MQPVVEDKHMVVDSVTYSCVHKMNCTADLMNGDCNVVNIA